MPQPVGPDMPREIRVRHELPGRPSRPRRHQPVSFTAVPAHQPHGFGDVAVVAHHDAAIVGIEPTVIQQMHREIDIRAFLLGPDHLNRALVSHRLRQRGTDPVSQKMPEVHLRLLAGSAAGRGDRRPGTEASTGPRTSPKLLP